jgi:hypothetical protein
MSLKHFRAQEGRFAPAQFHQLRRLMWITLMLSAYGSHGAAAQTPPPAALQISAGGSANGSWSADENFSGGNPDTHSIAINTLFDSRPAPQSVYQSERRGVMTYTMPGLTANAPYTVDLHFAESSFNSVGAREFNVLINGTQVLTNFDIFAATGGENMAILKSFPATANGSGEIVIQFAAGSADEPKIDGIEILPVSTLFTSGGIYTLVSKTSGLALDNEGSTMAANDAWQYSRQAGNTNQQWQINLLPNGTYNLINLTSGMALDNGGSTTAGTWMTQNVSSTADANQQFAISSVGSGYYQLVVASSGMALDNDGATSNGGEVHQWAVESGNSNQEWQLVSVQIGANTPFITYEAESGVLSGGASVVSLTARPTTKFSSPALEASGHAYVNLSATGQAVTWTNNTGKDITFINVRYSIPDASGGGGITSTLDLYVNGVFRQALNVNSKQTWLYESSSSSNESSQTPSTGNPYQFWDETHAFITGAAVAPGSTITLQQDSTNSASFYNIDLVDLEAPPAALTQPANSLSLATDCGGQANNSSFDNSTALQNCFTNAASESKSVWIPQGTFYLNTATHGWTATGITIQGAGMWYSTLYYNPPIPQPTQWTILHLNSSNLMDLSVDGNGIAETGAGGSGYAANVEGSNWVLDSDWIQHEGPAVWANGTGGLVENMRIDTTWADGINLNNTPTLPGNNLTAINNFIRGSGDDGMAINDTGSGQEMTAITVMNNTIAAPWEASNIGVYGGQTDLVANNLITDSVNNYGISAGIFGSAGGPLESGIVEGNVLYRAGSLGNGTEHPAIGINVGATADSAVQNVTVRGNAVINAQFDGMDIDGVADGIFSNNNIDAPGSYGIMIYSGAQGAASFICNAIENPGSTAFVNNSTGMSISGSCNTFATVVSPLTQPTITLLPTALPGGTYGTIYTQPITGSGGTAP